MTIRGVKVGKSPAWLKNLLATVNLRSINKIVNLTNFVLMEFGQLLHAFDADKIIVKILNPLSKNLNVMHQTLMWGGLESIDFNQNLKVGNIKFFMFGSIFFFYASKVRDEAK